MAEHIPIVTGTESFALAARYYNDSEFVRVQLERAQTIAESLPKPMKLWLDPGVDGLDNLEQRHSKPGRNNPWYEFMQQFPGFNEIGEKLFWIKPDPDRVDKFVTTLLDFCVGFKPTWLTVPQLPIVNDSSRNKINIALAKATGKWKSKRNFSGRLILPLIFTHQNQLNGKTERNPKVKHAGRCYHESQADGFWAVDKSLSDESGSKTLQNTRFPGIVDLHTELNEEIPSRIRIAGPYWGLNLVLWAKGLVDFPAIGIGNSYQYFLAGGFANTPDVKLSIAPLRRRVGVARLGHWLDETIKILGDTHPATAELAQMRKNLVILSGQEPSRRQVAIFYKGWFDMLASTPRPGRSLALFQDLSKAYALGKTLPDFEKREGTARRPESVVEPFMLNCL